MKLTVKIGYPIIKMYYTVEGLLALYLGNEKEVQKGSILYEMPPVIPSVILWTTKKTNALASLEFISFDGFLYYGKIRSNYENSTYVDIGKQVSSIFRSIVDAKEILGSKILVEVSSEEKSKGSEKYAIDKYFYYDESTDTLYLLKKIPEDCEGIKIPTEDKKAGMILLLERGVLIGVALYGCQQFLSKTVHDWD